jgi:hypothetical protein
MLPKGSTLVLQAHNYSTKKTKNMKKKKLKLNTVKIESFVTTIDDKEKETIGGASGWAVCSLYLSGCLLSATCTPAPPPIRDKTPARIVSHNQPGICQHIGDESAQWIAIGLKCPYTAVDPGTIGGA